MKEHPTLGDILESALKNTDDFTEYHRLTRFYKLHIREEVVAYIDSVIAKGILKIETIKLLRQLVPEFGLTEAKRFYEARHERFEAINKAQDAINEAEREMAKALARL